MKILLRALTASLVVIIFSGCGQSGQLFIPGDPSEIKTPPTEEPTESSEKDEDPEDEAETK